MIPFRYEEPETLAVACSKIDHADLIAIAGGKAMIDLMKLNVLTPNAVVHVRKILPSTVIAPGDSFQYSTTLMLDIDTEIDYRERMNHAQVV